MIGVPAEACMHVLGEGCAERGGWGENPPQVRAHGVAVLERCEDEELLGTALQLVQALRYEAAHDSPLAAFLVRRAVPNATLAILLHWCARQNPPQSPTWVRPRVAIRTALTGARCGLS